MSNYQQQPNPSFEQFSHPAPQPPKKKHTVRNIVIGVTVGIFVLIGGCTALVGGALSSVDTTPPGEASTPLAETSSKPVAAPKTTEAPKPAAPKYGTPVAKNFKLTVKMLSKRCFGSAGCNVTYRVLVAYNGPNLDPGKTYEVIYEVRGGEDGPATNTLTVEGGQSSVQDEEFVSTSSSKAKLIAVATDVMEG